MPTATFNHPQRRGSASAPPNWSKTPKTQLRRIRVGERVVDLDGNDHTTATPVFLSRDCQMFSPKAFSQLSSRNHR